MLAITGAFAIALAVLGGAGYASSAVGDVVRTIRHHGIAPTSHGRSLASADQAQYANPKPAVSPPPPPPAKSRQTPAGATKHLGGGQPHTSGLPFTGTSLLLPLLVGLGLVAAGLALRRGARRDPTD